MPFFLAGFQSEVSAHFAPQGINPSFSLERNDTLHRGGAFHSLQLNTHR